MREVVERNAITRQCLPVVVVPEATTTVNAETWNAADATVDFSATLPVIELYQNFKLTAIPQPPSISQCVDDQKNNSCLL